MVGWKKNVHEVLTNIIRDDFLGKEISSYKDRLYELYLLSLWLPTFHYESSTIRRLLLVSRNEKPEELPIWLFYSHLYDRAILIIIVSWLSNIWIKLLEATRWSNLVLTLDRFLQWFSTNCRATMDSLYHSGMIFLSDYRMMYWTVLSKFPSRSMANLKSRRISPIIPSCRILVRISSPNNSNSASIINSHCSTMASFLRLGNKALKRIRLDDLYFVDYVVYRVMMIPLIFAIWVQSRKLQEKYSEAECWAVSV